MAKSNKTHVVLKKAFEKLKKTNSKFSIRALAMRVSVSHVFMMKLLKGEAQIPNGKIPLIISALKLDDVGIIELKEAIIEDAIADKLSCFETKIDFQDKLELETFEEYPDDFSYVLSNWYHLAILDLLTCEGFSKTVDEIALKLDLPREEVEESLQNMQHLGLVRRDAKEWVKVNENIRFPKTTPSEVTKNYYKEILGRIDTELDKTDQSHYEARSITNISMAIDPNKVAEAKEKILKFSYKLATEMASDNPKQVYFLSTNFIPVSKK